MKKELGILLVAISSILLAYQCIQRMGTFCNFSGTPGNLFTWMLVIIPLLFMVIGFKVMDRVDLAKLIVKLLLLDVLFIVIVLAILQPISLNDEKFLWSFVLFMATLIGFGLLWLKEKKPRPTLLWNLLLGPVIACVLMPYWFGISVKLHQEQFYFNQSTEKFELLVNASLRNFEIFKIDDETKTRLDFGDIEYSNDTILLREQLSFSEEAYLISEQELFYVDSLNHLQFINKKETPPIDSFSLYGPVKYFIVNKHLYDFKNKGDKALLINE